MCISKEAIFKLVQYSVKNKKMDTKEIFKKYFHDLFSNFRK